MKRSRGMPTVIVALRLPETGESPSFVAAGGMTHESGERPAQVFE
jgi:hypothetical protein